MCVKWFVFTPSSNQWFIDAYTALGEKKDRQAWISFSELDFAAGKYCLKIPTYAKQLDAFIYFACNTKGVLCDCNLIYK